MIYATSTRCRRHGIFFEPHELEPLGVFDNSHCWGLWAEGRRFDERCQLDPDDNWFTNESPHLVVSSIHPDQWPDAFSLQVFLERRSHERDKPATECDAFYGLTDALARCGVNMLSVQTAQIGYSLVTLTATCQFPRLRALSARLTRLADQAGDDLQRVRHQLQTDGSGSESMLREAAQIAHARRAAAFQAIGLAIMPRLVELEARLTFIENQRFLWQQVGSGAALKARREGMLQDAHDPVRYRLLVGSPLPSNYDPAEIERRYMQALSTAWFLNRSAVEAGENSYYLAYYNMSTRDRTRAPVADDAPPPCAAEDDVDELSDQELDALFDVYYRTLQNRPLGRTFRQIIPASPDMLSPTTREPEVRSGAAERVTQHSTTVDFEARSLSLFFQQQALWPLKITALPTLAHARFWKHGGGSSALLSFRYQHTMLTPEGSRQDPDGPMSPIFEFLNGFVDDESPRGVFGPGSVVLANLDTHNQYMRLRFIRPQAEPQAYLEVRLHYHVTANGTERPVSQGILKSLVAVIIGNDFRIERAFNRMILNDKTEEQAVLHVIIRSANSNGLERCARAHANGTARNELASEWTEQLRDLVSADAHWRELRIEVLGAMVPPGR